MAADQFRYLRVAGFAALAPLLILASACGTPVSPGIGAAPTDPAPILSLDGSGAEPGIIAPLNPEPIVDPNAPGFGVYPSDWPEGPCSMIDQIVFNSSAELEAAAELIVRGQITSIELEDEDSTPYWIVGFHITQIAGDYSLATPDITIALNRLCGDAPYGEQFMVGSEYIFLLNPNNERRPEGANPVFHVVQTDQGVIPVFGGIAEYNTAKPLPRALVTISPKTAASLGVNLVERGYYLDPGLLPLEAGAWALDIPFPFNREDLDPWSTVGGAAWTSEPGLLYIFTWGSSSCPLLVNWEATDVFGKILVTFQDEDPGRACTADLRAVTSVVAVPPNLDNGEVVTVQLGDLGSVELQPRPEQLAIDEPWLVGEPSWIQATQ